MLAKLIIQELILNHWTITKNQTASKSNSVLIAWKELRIIHTLLQIGISKAKI